MGQPSEDIELISQTGQRDSDALLQTTNPFPETLHNARCTFIRQSCSTMHETNNHLPLLWSIVIMEVKLSLCQILNSPPVQSKAVPGKTGSKTMVTNARWMGALSCAKLPVSITIPTPSISSPAATFLCPHMVAENMETWSLGTLS